MLLERTTGARSLAALTWNGGDDEASQIICSVASRLHAPRPRPLPELIPLERWFEALPRVAAQEGGKFARAYIVMRELLESPRDVTPLHGDLHHDNILDGGERGWLAIDPKRLRGERGFDFANIFSNPDVAEPAPWRAAPPFAVATAPGRLARQAHIVAEAAGLERERLLKWVVAWCGLSAAWHAEDGNHPAHDFAVGDIAAAELGLS